MKEREDIEYEKIYDISSGNSINSTLAGCGAAGSGKDIGRDAALEAALSDAQTTEENVTRLKVSEDREDGQKVYEIRFDADGMEYDYEVAASDGQILNAEREELAPGSEENTAGSNVSAVDGTEISV